MERLAEPNIHWMDAQAAFLTLCFHLSLQLSLHLSRRFPFHLRSALFRSSCFTTRQQLHHSSMQRFNQKKEA